MKQTTNNWPTLHDCPSVRTSFVRCRAFAVTGPSLWNGLPFQLRAKLNMSFLATVTLLQSHSLNRISLNSSRGMEDFNFDVFCSRIFILTTFVNVSNNNNNNNFRVSNIRVSNRTLIYNVCPEAALT